MKEKVAEIIVAVSWGLAICCYLCGLILLLTK